MAPYVRWQIKVYNPNDGQWSGNGLNWKNFRNPSGRSYEQSIVSTAEIVKLVDASEGIILPEIKFTEQPITFEWNQVYVSGNTDNFIENMSSYVKGCSGIVLKTHLTNNDSTIETISGRFLEMSKGNEPYRDYLGREFYVIKATFKPISILSGIGM